MHYLALGDSYTIGESVAASERWPVVLAARLRGRGREVAEPDVVARTGWTTGELAAALAATTLRERYDLVTLLIGVNNQFRGLGLGEFRTQLRALLAFAVKRAGGDPGRVVVVSIPDWGVTPFAEGRDRAAIGREIDAFNDVNRAEAARAGARWVDVTGISRAAAHDPSLVAPDGLHPSAAMYRRWLERIAPAADSALGGPAR